MAQKPMSFGPQDIAMGHAAHVLLTRLIGLLIENKIISNEDASKMVLECISIQEIGGPVNVVAAEILKDLVPPAPPTSRTSN